MWLEFPPKAQNKPYLRSGASSIDPTSSHEIVQEGMPATQSNYVTIPGDPQALLMMRLADVLGMLEERRNLQQEWGVGRSGVPVPDLLQSQTPQFIYDLGRRKR